MHVESARRVRREIQALAASGVDSTTLGTEAERLLRSVVQFDRACWHDVDPATGLITSVIGESAPDDPLLPVLEYGSEDVNQYVTLARQRPRVAGLIEATGGKPSSSRRYSQVLEPMGIGDELTASFVVDASFWGCVRLYRHHGRPPFEPVELSFVAALGRSLAVGFRDAALGRATPSDEDNGPGLIILDAEDRIRSISVAAERWLAEFVDRPSTSRRLPHSILALAARARVLSRAGTSPTAERQARARVLGRSGRWLVVHAGRLERGRDDLAVVLQPAPSIEMAALIVAAWGLTRRERMVTEAIARGLSNKEIARDLAISPHTVDDHLRAIFVKAEVASRAQLVSKLFFEHYHPGLFIATPETVVD